MKINRFQGKVKGETCENIKSGHETKRKKLTKLLSPKGEVGEINAHQAVEMSGLSKIVFGALVR